MLSLPRPNVDDRTALRPPTPSDAVELFQAIDRNRAHLRQWLAWLDRVQSPGDVEDYMRQSIQQRQDDTAFQLLVVVGGEIRGAIGVHLIDWNNRSTSIGYWLDATLQGQGVMTACCRHLVDHLFDELKLHRVVIRCATGNVRSQAIPERLGFVREGVLREAEWLYDHYVDLVAYARLRTD